MNSSVFCKKKQTELAALPNAPLCGAIGEIILANISKEAFDEWLELQIKIINEERLDLSDEPAQRRLYQQMVSYLNIEDLVE